MEGPTPVSAFLHAASMITAGVYFFFVFPFYIIKSVFLFFSFFTTLYFSFFALFYFDFKRIVASSTGSQIGYIFFFVCSYMLYNAFLLLFIHGLFKFYLFFIAGYLISMFFNFHDLRVINLNFISFLFILLSLLALAGLFFFWGGLIKELFIFSFFNLNFYLFYSFIILFLFSSFYCIKILFVPLFSSFYLNYNYFFFYSFIVLFFFYFLFNSFNIQYGFSYPSFFSLYLICFILILFFFNYIVNFFFDFIYLIFLNILFIFYLFSIIFYISIYYFHNFFVS